jgi:hypothetical protein
LSKAYVVIVLEILQILIFVLAKCLCDVWVLDHVQDGLGFELQPLVCRDGPFSLPREF